MKNKKQTKNDIVMDLLRELKVKQEEYINIKFDLNILENTENKTKKKMVTYFKKIKKLVEQCSKLLSEIQYIQNVLYVKYKIEVDIFLYLVG